MDIAELEESPETWEASMRLDKDLREAAKSMSPSQQRIIVDLYYLIQEPRKRAANQLRATKDEPNTFVDFLFFFLHKLEKIAGGGLDLSSREKAVSRWAKSQFGIGPVIASALEAYIDIEKTPGVSNLWSFAGLNPQMKWDRGQRRPYNANLKILAWKIGDSFVKFHNHPACFYGHIYAARKQLEVERNEAGRFRELARETLATKTFKNAEVRRIYESGKLPDSRIDHRARRIPVKLFLSHYYQVAYYEHYGTLPRPPYIQETQPGLHVHYIPPPGYEHIFIWPERGH
jgi:hypothetical protein